MNGITTLIDTNIIGTISSDKDFFNENFSKKPVIGISIITKYEFLSNPDLTPKGKYLFKKYLDTIEVYDILKTDKVIQDHLISIRKKI